MQYGYVRVSSTQQTSDQQRDALVRAGVAPDSIVADEGVSGTVRGQDRPGYASLLARLQHGDSVTVARLDRLGRNALDVLQQVEVLTARGVVVRGLADGVDSSTPAGKMIIGIMASLAEYERTCMLERQRAALDAARARGQQMGRKPALNAQQRAHARELADAGKSVRDIARLLGVGKSTVQRALESV